MNLLEIYHKSNINGQSIRTNKLHNRLLRLNSEFDSTLLPFELTTKNGIGLGLRRITR